MYFNDTALLNSAGNSHQATRHNRPKYIIIDPSDILIKNRYQQGYPSNNLHRPINQLLKLLRNVRLINIYPGHDYEGLINVLSTSGSFIRLQAGNLWRLWYDIFIYLCNIGTIYTIIFPLSNAERIVVVQYKCLLATRLYRPYLLTPIYVKTSWHGTNFYIIGPLWVDSPHMWPVVWSYMINIITEHWFYALLIQLVNC